MPIPSDTHVVGDTGHTADHNNIADELTTLTAATATETTRAEAAEALLAPSTAVAAETTRATAAEALRAVIAGDLGGTPASPQTVSTHLTVATNAAATGTVNLDPTSTRVFAVTQTGNCVFTFTSGSSYASGTAYSFTLYLSQDATGGRTTTWPGSVTWVGGTVPTLVTTTGALNVLVFETVNAGTTWYGSLVTAPAFPLTVANGGTGGATLGAYQLLAGGTTGTGAVQSVSGTGTSGQVLTSNGASALPTFQAATGGGGSGTSAGIFGDASDGSATLDGTATVTWASKASSVYTMTRDAMLTSLTVNSGVTLNTANYRIFCTGTVSNAGTIASNGNNATSATAAAAQATGPLIGNGGGAGATGAGATGGASGTRWGTGTGSAGGLGSAGAAGAAGGAQKTGITPHRVPGPVLSGYSAWAGTGYPVGGAAGGGGGGGDGTNSGGGGGAGGGILAILAHAITNTGTMSANGGNGFTPTTGNCGGGGGGGGGLVLGYTLAAWTAGTTSVTGGTQGSGVGTGAAGTAGTAGTVLNVVIT